MNKWLFLWTAPPATVIDAFATTARAQLTESLRGIPSVTVHITEQRTPRLSIVPFTRRAMAMVTVRDDIGNMERARRQLESLPGTLAGYRVIESVPIARSRTWGVGERAPGACMLTIFRRSPRCDRDTFFREWHERHTPMAMKIHPSIGYIRNVVEAIVVPGSPPWDGVVTEDFASTRDVIAPLRLFGGPLRAVPNMIRVGLHVSTFLDLRTLENHLVSEYVLSD